MTAGADDRGRLLWARDAMLAAAHNATLENAADPEMYDAAVHRAARARSEFLRVVGELRRRLSAADLGAMLDQPPAAIDELTDQLTAEQQGEIAAVCLLQELMARVTKGAYDTPDGEA